MLISQQQAFAKALPRLLDKAHALGYSVTLGDAYRDPRVHGALGKKGSYSSANSRHKMRLAIDLNLFKDGKFLNASSDHLPLGMFWQSMGGIWGGYQDGNHYEWPLVGP